MKLQEVKNTKFKFGESAEYLGGWIELPDGKLYFAAFTEGQIADAIERAKKQPELNLPRPSRLKAWLCNLLGC